MAGDAFGNGIYKSSDAGLSGPSTAATCFALPATGAPGTSCCALADENIKSLVNPNNSNIVIAGASYGLFLSYDAGVT